MAEMASATPRVPAVFIGHGSPTFAFEDNRYTRAWGRLGESLPRPAAVIAISAHWYTHGTGVTVAEWPQTVHDFYGFPAEFYEYHYRAPGAPWLAERVRELLRPTNVIADREWGFDHGTWAVLKHVYPATDVPTIQLSIDGTQSPEYHYELGKRLAPLRDENVLVIGAGNVVHNLRDLRRSPDAPADPLAVEFNDAIRDAVLRNDHQTVIHYTRFGASAAYSVPTPEHFLPLLYVLGMKGPDDRVQIPIDGIEMASTSMLSVLIEAETNTRPSHT